MLNIEEYTESASIMLRATAERDRIEVFFNESVKPTTPTIRIFFYKNIVVKLLILFQVFLVIIILIRDT